MWIQISHPFNLIRFSMAHRSILEYMLLVILHVTLNQVKKIQPTHVTIDFQNLPILSKAKL